MWGTLSAITTTTTPQAAHNGAIDDIKDAANETYVSYLPGRLHPDVFIDVSISGQAGASSHKTHVDVQRYTTYSDTLHTTYLHYRHRGPKNEFLVDA